MHQNFTRLLAGTPGYIALIAFLFAGCGATPSNDEAIEPPHDVIVAFWNVENLFDCEDDPRVAGDEEFTPGAEKRWTQERLERKVENLARVIARIDEESCRQDAPAGSRVVGGSGPDLIGLAEVENRAVLEMLVERLQEATDAAREKSAEKPARQYKIVHQDSPSSRGIDCALLYDAARFNLIAADFHRVTGTAGPTRDIVEAELSVAGGARLFVLVNHWPSSGSVERDRMQAARTLRKRLDQILQRDAQADVVVLGDFNEQPDGEAVEKTLGTAEEEDEVLAERSSGPAREPVGGDRQPMLNTMWPLFRSGSAGTYVYHNRWETLDQIIVSRGLLDQRGFTWRKGSSQAAIVVDDQLFDLRGSAIPRPNRTYTGNQYHKTGYSDHLPVRTLLEVEKR